MDFAIHTSHPIPTNHAVISLTLSPVTTEELLERSQELGRHHIGRAPVQERTKTPIPAHSIDRANFCSQLDQTIGTVREETNNASPQAASETISQVMYKAAKDSRIVQRVTEPVNTQKPRWQRVLQAKDAKQLWKAIDWSGTFEALSDRNSGPSHEEFAQHFRRLLNPLQSKEVYEPDSERYIPILDDPILPSEVLEAIEEMKPNKAAGTDGIAPDILKWLSDQWIFLLTDLFNEVFSGDYPTEWTRAKVFTLYKKGNHKDPANYRGISILVALAKVYDAILAARFKLWYAPCEEQAGAQKGRSCEEQVLILKLLIDVARKTKRSLLIAFVDYEKAYDKVNRKKLMQMLDDHGCGTKFLLALQRSLIDASGVVGQATFTTTAGVKQGGGTSCPLFTFFIDATVRELRQYGSDGWIEDLSSLLFMDDTAIIATSRQALEQKLQILKQCTDNLGMVIHPKKSQYMTVNNDSREPILLDNVCISKTTEYNYLGCLIQDAKVTDIVKAEIDRRWKHVWKYMSFLRVNADAPFKVKKKVWDAAMNAALFYGCATWLSKAKLRSIEKPYMQTLKTMLSIRTTIPADLILAETGCPSPAGFVRSRQQKFLAKMRQRGNGSLVVRAMNMATQEHSPMGDAIREVESLDLSTMQSEIHHRIHQATTTRCTTYLEINPDLTVHCVYTDQKSAAIPERHRIAFTRLRLSSHRLRIETGRWARIPREERLCVCGEQQTESHVLLQCERNIETRETYLGDRVFVNLNSLFSEMPPDKCCAFVYCVLKTFE